jgi:hypothetical protein
MTISFLIGVPSDVDAETPEGRRLVAELLQSGRARLVPIAVHLTDVELNKRVEMVTLQTRKA